MDVISRAMEKGLHLCGGIKAEEQTWELFEKSKEEKKIFLFGMGGGMGYFLRNCCNHMKIAGVIDNDKSKQGQKLGWWCSEAEKTEYEGIEIQSPDILNGYDKDEIVILITSINVYLPIVRQLEQLGIYHYYILLMMEAGKRKNQGNDIGEDYEKLRDGYTEWCCRQKIENRKIVMMIGVYGGHAKQITKALLEERSDLDIVWVVYDQYMEKPEGVRLVCGKNWKRFFYEMETAKIWLFDDIISTSIRKREGQIYIQVKHWSISAKKLYLDDNPAVLPPELKAAIQYDGARMDYLFTGSRYDEECCRSCFQFQGETVRLGSARSDILFDTEVKKRVYQRFALGKNAKVCLYAPTYRQKELEKNGSMAIALDMELLLDALRARWDGEWFLFVRLHPGLVLDENVLPENKHIISAGNYPDSEELVAASDVMITDYSSIMFEQAYKKGPVFLYVPDMQKYLKEERGFWIDYNELPFPAAESDEELYRYIKDFEQKEYEKKVLDFFDKYGIHEDGHASGRAAKFIMSRCGL